MAKIYYKIQGGSGAPIAAEASTVGELKRKLGYEKYSAAINGEAASDGDSLSEDNMVTLAPAVKGGI